VVIGVYNRRERAAEAIESARAQTVRDIEILVVDDGSTDGAGDFLRARFSDDPRVRVISQENRGCAGARNRGIDEARAPWVALLDSDDRATPARLERQLDALARDPGATLCFCDAEMDRGRRGTARMSRRKRFEWPLSLDAMFRGAWAAPSTWVLSTATARRLRFDTAFRFQDDIDFLYRFFESDGSAVVVEEPLVAYDDRPSAPGDTPRLMERRAEVGDAAILVFKRSWERLPPERRARVPISTRLRRYLADHCERTGRFSSARHHLLAWWRARPMRLALLLRWARLRRPDRPDLGASPLGDLDIRA
jgi:teichuronic acid biosynthesis glycosyltransferase TuaG